MRRVSFRCPEELWDSLIEDANERFISVSDVIRERLSASYLIPIRDIEGQTLVKPPMQLDPRLSDPVFIDKLLLGAVTSHLMYDVQTRQIDNTFDKIAERFDAETRAFLRET